MNSSWASPPGVPLEEVTPFPGMAVPKDGMLVPRDGPGFALGLSLDDLEKLKSDGGRGGRACDKALVRLLPWLLLMYVLAYLDRANLGFAKNAFQASTGISEAAYAFGVGFSPSPMPPSRSPATSCCTASGRAVGSRRIMVSWGLVSAAMAFVTTATGFYVVRVLLGIAEAGFFPRRGLFPVALVSRCAPRPGDGHFLFRRAAEFCLWGPLSGLLLDADGMGGLHGWQWMFLIEGLLASIVGVLVYFRLSRQSGKGGVAGAEERARAGAAIAAEDREKSAHGVTSLLQGLLNWRVVYLGAIYFLIQACVYGVVYYLPPQVGRCWAAMSALSSAW